MELRRHTLFLLLCGFALNPALPAQAAEMPMGDYLGLLAQISPAAREGAEAYLLAHRRRCGGELSTTALRRALSDGSGDPVLIGMMRASQQRDAAGLAALSLRVACQGRP